MTDVSQFLNVLGRKVKDKITGFKGICVGVCFELPGYIQCDVKPEGTDKEGKISQGYWFDPNRLLILNEKPVMNLPDFAAYVPKEPEKKPYYPKGPIDKTSQRA